MNCLSYMLNQAAAQEKVKYHTNCRAMKLTHLSFADDLLIFIDGSLESVQNVLQVLHEFEQRSDLAVSFQKTSFFASGLDDSEVATIQASTGMVCGTLPVRYLGVPLSSKKLNLTNCEPLIHQIKARLSNWSVKSLSFSGRLLLIKTRLENGLTARFLFDNWSPFGNLAAHLNLSSSRLGIPLRATVASLRRNGVWRIPQARSDAQLELHAFLTTVEFSENEDYYEWEIDGKVSKKFNTAEAYTFLRGNIDEVNWSSIVLMQYSIPRHNFLVWLAILDRCPTRDRLIKWGLNVPPTCLLCNSAEEARNHLFHECNFSFDLWSLSANRLGIQPNRQWDHTVSHMRQLPRQRAHRSKRLLILLAWQSTIYWTWSERNTRLHQNTFKTVDAIFTVVD
ncbi:uncharacterized protein LOC106398140 [Brassica napus]|uniref:uncharacterized protein LOC106398140 n=1 Tax=Brassica napus TaxID=3708 RepID=UPI0020788E06|nr:uncharacterized protein LOC106398140 [Brassica napus]